MAKPAVFIVEDEAIVANDIKETLKSLGYSVSGISASGELAIEKVKETQPNLVLMDIHLAGKMDGIEAAGQIHSLYDIPVIYLTAYADKDLLERAKITEPYGYVLKPYDERELHSIIEMALYKHKIDREIKKRDAILFAVSSAVEWMLRVSYSKTSKEDVSRDIDASTIQDFLALIGLTIDTSTISIFKIHLDPEGSPLLSMKYEWTGPGIYPSLYKRELKEFTLSSLGLSRWHELLSRGEVVLASTNNVPESEKRFFSLLGVQSGAILPIIIRDKLWGFIGFFHVLDRYWSVEEIEALRITANLLGAAMG
ncbi:MAG: response regulator [Methanoregulaceae archaeon]|jgi:CheY-like chemotaxis protein